MGKIVLKSFIVLLIVVMLPITSFAASNEATNGGESKITTEISNEEKDLVNTENIKGNELQEDNKEKNDLEQAINLNNKLFEIYGTWTSIITIILILITILGIAIPFYNMKIVDSKIKKANLKIKKENEEERQKQLVLNNALMLSAAKEYFSANKLLEDLLKENPKDTYIHLLIGRNVFYDYEIDISPNERELNDEDLQVLETAINHFLFVGENKDMVSSDYFQLGSVFPDSIIHELSMLTETLLEYSIKNNVNRGYTKIAVRVIKEIENLLDINEFSDIANEDQTSVYIMNYIGLNHQLAKTYLEFGNIQAKKQYEYVLKLYSISNELDYKEEINECKEVLKTISQ